MSPELLFTRGEAARYLGISVSTLKRRTLDGTYPCRRVGPRLVRYSMSDLAAIVAASEVKSKQPPARVKRRRGQYPTYRGSTANAESQATGDVAT